jgi:hypothetical protein
MKIYRFRPLVYTTDVFINYSWSCMVKSYQWINALSYKLHMFLINSLGRFWPNTKYEFKIVSNYENNRFIFYDQWGYFINKIFVLLDPLKWQNLKIRFRGARHRVLLRTKFWKKTSTIDFAAVDRLHAQTNIYLH